MAKNIKCRSQNYCPAAEHAGTTALNQWNKTNNAKCSTCHFKKIQAKCKKSCSWAGHYNSPSCCGIYNRPYHRIQFHWKRVQRLCLVVTAALVNNVILSPDRQQGPSSVLAANLKQNYYQKDSIFPPTVSIYYVP